jgi:hypothetical protein
MFLHSHVKIINVRPAAASLSEGTDTKYYDLPDLLAFTQNQSSYFRQTISTALQVAV